ncbi:hypothetical protein KI126_001360 [Enterococcus faecium]|nr:hypothetical protein [Enterococcus faecium]
MKYRKKQAVVEAMQLTNENLLEVKEWCNGELVPNAETSGYDLYISNLEGIMHADINDYIIQGVEGNFYPCKPDIFEKLFVAIDDEEDQLIGIIYSQLLEEFGFGYSEKDLWMIAENIAEKIVNQIPQLNDNQKIVLEWLKSNRNSLKVPMLAFYELAELADENTNLAYHQLDSKQEIEVIAAFAQWGLEQEEAE